MHPDHRPPPCVEGHDVGPYGEGRHLASAELLNSGTHFRAGRSETVVTAFRSDNPASIRAFARLNSLPVAWRSITALDHAVRAARVLRELLSAARRRRDQPLRDQSRYRRSQLGIIVVAASIGLIVLVNVVHDALVTSAAGLVLALVLLAFLRQSQDSIAAIDWQATSRSRQRVGYLLASVMLVGLAVYAVFLGTDVLERVLLLTPVVLGGGARDRLGASLAFVRSPEGRRAVRLA